ncbi:MAG: hypothetical protein IIZ54_05335 [Selenomonadaceae bacterium]|nr:hypothetical protein [Selenomonadaceae bacterium]
MATSSITHNFFITDPKAAERFVQALEESEEEAKHREPVEPPGKILTEPKELAEFAARIKAQLKAQGKL